MNRVLTMAAAATLGCAPTAQRTEAPVVAASAPGVTQVLATRADSMQRAAKYDTDGETAKARALYQRLVDTAPDPATKAAAQRAMAMSYAFDADCANTEKLMDQVIAYWATREQAEPQNAFAQQGGMANEAARVCIDAGELDAAERLYRRGTALGLREPEPRTNPRSLWEYRLAHALGRIAARRGDTFSARRQLVEARRILDADPAMARQQERFNPYLMGYVSLYLGDLAGAEFALTKALAIPENQGDPFMQMLLASVYEKQGQRDKAKALYQKAYDMATNHNPTSAHVRPTARRKLASM
jgi:tetratricopeptide (TPR) repeat protein